MRSALILSLGLSLVVAAPAHADPVPCTCERSRGFGDWCERHDVGHLAGVEVRSKLVFETLDAHGHDIDPQSLRCPSCRLAFESDGFCEEHRWGFVGEQAYFSRLTYLLARNDPVRRERLSCPVCRKNAEGHGWCGACSLGLVGDVAFSDRREFAQVEEALRRLELANDAADRCEYCAAAILADTTCPFCRITYRDGVPTKTNAASDGGD